MEHHRIPASSISFDVISLLYGIRAIQVPSSEILSVDALFQIIPARKLMCVCWQQDGKQIVSFGHGVLRHQSFTPDSAKSFCDQHPL